MNDICSLNFTSVISSQIDNNSTTSLLIRLTSLAHSTFYELVGSFDYCCDCTSEEVLLGPLSPVAGRVYIFYLLWSEVWK